MRGVCACGARYRAWPRAAGPRRRTDATTFQIRKALRGRATTLRASMTAGSGPVVPSVSQSSGVGPRFQF